MPLGGLWEVSGRPLGAPISSQTDVSPKFPKCPFLYFLYYSQHFLYFFYIFLYFFIFCHDFLLTPIWRLEGVGPQFAPKWPCLGSDNLERVACSLHQKTRFSQAKHPPRLIHPLAGKGRDVYASTYAHPAQRRAHASPPSPCGRPPCPGEVVGGASTLH